MLGVVEGREAAAFEYVDSVANVFVEPDVANAPPIISDRLSISISISRILNGIDGMQKLLSRLPFAGDTERAGKVGTPVQSLYIPSWPS